MGRKTKHVGNLTFDHKKKICLWKRDSPSLTQEQLAERAQREFALVKQPVQGIISAILKQSDRFLKVRDEDRETRRARPLNFPELDEALANWVLHCQARRIMLDGNMVKAKGLRLLEKLEIAEDQRIGFSNGWLQSFQNRHGFKSFRVHGESGSVDTSSIPDQIKRLRDVIKPFALADAYNFDESGLFYKLCPDKTIAARQIEGAKKSKTRITVALACNADGSDMREPFFIGHANKPRCFKKKTGEQLGFQYRNNKKAWMTAVLFREWLQAFDNDMENQMRKVLLLLDNASSHIITGLELRSVSVHFLPPNTTSKLQPLDAGIIAALKRRYRHRQLQHALDKEEEGVDRDIYAVDQLLAMKWVKSCWREIKGDLVLNCFRHTKLILGRSSSRRSCRETDELIASEIVSCMQRLRIRDPMQIDEFICNPAEDNTEIETVTDMELLDESSDAFFIEMSSGEPLQEDESHDDDLNVEGDSYEENTEQKVSAVRSVIFMLADHPDLEDKLMRDLRSLQSRMREQLRLEKEESMKQTSITRFFMASSQ